MAQTYTSARNLFGTLTDNNSTTNLLLGDTLINGAIRKYANSNGGKWWFLEKVATQPTVASQQAYTLPQSTRKIIDVYITVGSTAYTLIPVESPSVWASVLRMNLGTSDRAQFFYRQGNQVLIAPTPASAGSTITIRTRKNIVDLRNADYVTGTVTMTNADATVDGAGVAFTAAMIGRFINATSGDGEWYEIASRTDADTVELIAPYEGDTVAGSAYTIGELIGLPIGYHEMPIYDAVSAYWAKEKDPTRSKLFADMAKELYVSMLSEAGEKSEGAYMPPVENLVFRDPNIPEPTVPTSSFT
jgi:hypothetical protein